MIMYMMFLSMNFTKYEVSMFQLYFVLLAAESLSEQAN